MLLQCTEINCFRYLSIGCESILITHKFKLWKLLHQLNWFGFVFDFPMNEIFSWKTFVLHWMRTNAVFWTSQLESAIESPRRFSSCLVWRWLLMFILRSIHLGHRGTSWGTFSWLCHVYSIGNLLKRPSTVAINRQIEKLNLH